MRSPKFDIRQAKLKPLFTSGNLRRIWKKKVRDSMRNQFLLDPIDHLDFHHRLGSECEELERLIAEGAYAPTTTKRILVEKSKGLCRQLVIPNIRDALILQALSDELYRDIKGKSPSANSFFEPQDHTFSDETNLFSEPEYGTFRAWLDFQKTIFKFSDENDFLIITDVANFYDSISYVHLRNIVSDLVPVREPILDMLIYVLSGLLWQPDYMPRVEIGLPQINIDAPRILAHCFLYELDEYLASHVGENFVRFMDDIDVGVNSIHEAKHILKSIDLVLQTRQVRLNSGKTQIITKEEAKKHFRIRENVFLNRFTSHIDRRVAAGISLDRERRWIKRSVRSLHKRRQFDTGNGEKILKRALSISSRVGVEVDDKTLLDTLIRRPGSRTPVLRLISRLPLNEGRTSVIRKFVGSGMIVDDASYVEVANFLVEGVARNRGKVQNNIEKIIEYIPVTAPFSAYAHIWLSSKYMRDEYIHELCLNRRRIWVEDEWLGRLVGGLYPIFINSPLEDDFKKLVLTAGSAAAGIVYGFHDRLRREKVGFDMSHEWLRAINKSKRAGVSHPRLLLLATALANETVPLTRRTGLIARHASAWADINYRSLARKTSGLAIPATAMPTYPYP